MSYDLDLEVESICRLCLGADEKLNNLFSTQIVDGYIKTMPEIINYCIDVSVLNHNSLPSKICDQCKSTIIKFYSFKEKCKRIEQVLQEMFLKERKVLSEQQPATSSGIAIVEKLPEIKQQKSEVVLVSVDQPELNLQQFEKDDIEIVEDVEIEEVVESGGSIYSLVEDTMDSSSRDNLIDEYIIENDTVTVVVDASDTERTLDEMFNSDVESVEFDEIVPFSNDASIPQQEQDLPSAPKKSRPDWLDRDNLPCAVCSELCQSMTEYVQHCQEKHFYCEPCVNVFATSEQLAKHVARHRNEGENKTEKPGRPIGRTILFCKICNRRMANSNRLKAHLKLHTAFDLIVDQTNFYECSDCCMFFARLEDIEKHNDTHHVANVKPGEDPACTDYQFLIDEKGKSKSGEPNDKKAAFICGLCTLAFGAEDEVRKHLITHSETFSCPIESCGCQYNSFSRLSVHILRKHVYNVQHSCSHCQQKFTSFDELQEHLKDTCPLKKFNCKHCDKKFFSQKALQAHMKNLFGKKYDCQFCGKSFNQKGELSIHNRKHNGERPFQCTVCDKTYKTASMRASHMDTHIEGKTFSCNICDKKLQTRVCYRNHMKRHTTEKKHICSYCEKAFFTKYHLKIHIGKIHEKKN